MTKPLYSFILIISISAATVLSQRCELYPVRPLGMTDRFNGIKDEQITASTYFSADTAPKYARLHYSDAFLWDWSLGGAGAWVARQQDTNQYLQVDFRTRVVIQDVAIQGRQGSREYVRDFYLQYADDLKVKNWMFYRDEYGSPYLFEGNEDDTKVKENKLEYPIIARYVRIYPQRWNRLIALRAEFFGCDYEVYTAFFNGKSWVDFRLDLPGRAIQTLQEDIRFRFRTRQSHGLILYGDDGQGDFISIELINGRIRYALSLGGSSETSLNEVMAGSLLDDDQWHDVHIQRNLKMINITVDRMEMWEDVRGDFVHLNLNRNLSLAGIQHFSGKTGITSKEPFVGCIENLYYNGLNMIRDARNMTKLGEKVSRVSGYVVHGSLAECKLAATSAADLITFRTDTGWIRMSKSGPVGTFTASFKFRTFQLGGTFIFHQLVADDLEKHFWLGMEKGSGNITLILSYLDRAKNVYPMKTVYPNRDPRARQPATFADGQWHEVQLSISANTIELTIDELSYKTIQNMNIPWKETTYIGGYWPKYPFFLGCMSEVQVNKEILNFANVLASDKEGSIEGGSCIIRDYCMPNPCKRDAKCTPAANSFTCDCAGTGYTGAVCYTSTYPTSCDEVKLLLRDYEQKLVQKNVTIDLDGSGVLAPFNVTCDFSKKGFVRTFVYHDSMKERRVDGYQEPGSYKHMLNYYGAKTDALSMLVQRSVRCQQEIVYKCKNTRLLSRPTTGTTTDDNYSWGWWIGRRGQPRYYWGGSAPGQKKCECGVLGTCQGSAVCNCDFPGSISDDQGLLTHKDDLPVTGIRLGDTGSSYDDRYSHYSIGHLECSGDSMFDNTVTFRKLDAALILKPIWSDREFDVMFLFKTTQSDAVFFQNLGKKYSHSVEVRLRQGRTIRFIYNVGFGVRVVDLRTTSFLNDNHWHVVRVERNRREATVTVDHKAPVALREPIDQAFRVFKFDQKLYIGSTSDYTDGYLGCLSNFMVNGVLLDLRKMVESGATTYGLSAGCHPQCAKKPCLNRGECQEHYSHYYCECGLTSFRGYVCGREVGASFIDGPFLKITLDLTGLVNVGTLDEYIQVGFKTKKKQGTLMLITSGNYREYIKVMINSQGGITVILDVGFERREYASRLKVDLCNDQQHTLVVWRTQEGKHLHFKVDDYDPDFLDFSTLLNKDADTRLDNPKYIFVGRNGTSEAPADGFEGCLFRMQFNNYFPLKMAFQEPKSKFVYIFPPKSILEDRCGIEETMPLPEKVEMRPFPTIPPNRTILRKDLDEGMNASLTTGIVLIVLFAILLLAIFFFCRNFTIQKGDYDTREAKGAEMVDHADMAIRFGRSGQPEVSGQEWWL